ncbi:MAG: response regulator transcription factor [Mycobacteriales bacterium]
MITVLLVDDHELIRQGLRRAFEREDDITVSGEAATVAEALELVESLSPDVVVLDVRLPDGDGLEAAKRIRASHPRTGIVILTMYGGDGPLFSALEAGASAFLNKDAPSAEVVAAARHAAANPTAFSSADLAAAMRRRLEPTGPRLSTREREVLTLLAEGLPIAALAAQLYISESTAKTHISKVYEKLGASNRAQALMVAIRLGLVNAG